MRIESKYYIKVKIDPRFSDDSVYKMVYEMESEMQKNFPEVFETNKLENITTVDTNSDDFLPTSAVLEGRFISNSPKNFATAKQLSNMMLKKFERKYTKNFSVDVKLSKIMINSYKSNYLTNTNTNIN